MPKWLLGRALTLVGVLATPFGGLDAQPTDTGGFASEQEAREYLRDNPTGPRANAAFLALSEFRIANENPGLTRDQIKSGFGFREQQDRFSDPSDPTPDNESSSLEPY